MGYRSLAVLVIKDIVLVDSLLKRSKLPKLFAEADSTHTNNLGKYWVWESIKWYEEYPDIKEIQDFISSLDDDEYGLLVLGEDGATVESLGQPWDFDMSIMSSINTPFGSM